jgi:uncharacterized protein (DUF433 family)
MTTAEWEQRITVDPAILTGKPIVKGTRLAVEFILELLSNGWSEAQILENYPGLARDDIRACLGYARWVVEGERVFAVRA